MSPSNDLLIKTMANLLKEGATMLDISCPSCDNILFKLKDGNMYCPNCKQYVVKEEDIKEINTKNDNNSIKNDIDLLEAKENFDLERNIIKKKIKHLIHELESEKSYVQIEFFLNLVNKLLDIYNKLPK